MKKVLPAIAGIVFALFLVGMFALVMSLTFSALGRIFPGNFVNQIVGLVLFDFAALAWGLAFVYKSESVMQYAIAALGFLVGLAGTFIMIASEVMLSAEGLTTAPDWVGKALVYGFVVSSALHLTLGYAHKAAAPDIDAAIRLGASRAEIISEAITQAEQELEINRSIMGSVIRSRLVADIKRQLRLPMTSAEIDIIDAEAKEPTSRKPRTKRGLPGKFISWLRRPARKSENPNAERPPTSKAETGEAEEPAE